MRSFRGKKGSRRDESGAALILALGFVFGVGMIIAATATFATNAFTTTINLGQERALEANAESAATLAVENVRFSFSATMPAITTITPTPTPTSCMPSGSPSYSGMATYCVLAGGAAGSGTSRVVQFYVCPVGATVRAIPNVCNGQALFATITYDDVPPNSVALTSNKCNSTSTLTCGIAMTVDTWDVSRADS